jgi:2'-5' RNA ligase
MSSNNFEGTYLPMIDLDELTPKLNESITDHIDKDDLLDDKDVTDNPIETHHHITLHIGLGFDDKKYTQVSDRHEPFTVTIGGLGKFSNKEKKFDDGTVHSYDVLWVDIKDQDGKLLALHEDFVDTFDKKYPQKEYKPHLTLAYLKHGKAQRYIDEWNDNIDIGQVNVVDFVVKKYGERDAKKKPVYYTLGKLN